MKLPPLSMADTDAARARLWAGANGETHRFATFVGWELSPNAHGKDPLVMHINRSNSLAIGQPRLLKWSPLFRAGIEIDPPIAIWIEDVHSPYALTQHLCETGEPASVCKCDNHPRKRGVWRDL